MKEKEGYIYKGYVLYAVPYPYPGAKWGTGVCIMKDSHGTVRSKTCSASNRWDTKEGADAHSLNYGKRIIDGTVEEVTIDF